MNKFNEQPENAGRRGFLGSMLGGALAVVGVGLGANKYMEAEKKLNDLHLSFKGEEENFSKAGEAASMLIEEMQKNNIETVKLSGNHPNNTVEILRTFLTEHLNSVVGKKYPSKDGLWTAGVYTKESLTTLIAESSALAEKQGK